MENILNILVQRGYPEKKAQVVGEDLSRIDPQLTSILDAWISTGEENDFEVEGYRLIQLKEKFKMSFPAALLTIDWLIKDPQNAIQCIVRGNK